LDGSKKFSASKKNFSFQQMFQHPKNISASKKNFSFHNIFSASKKISPSKKNFQLPQYFFSFQLKTLGRLSTLASA
jgi:hypothetical protein